jgi:plasmid stability protein
MAQKKSGPARRKIHVDLPENVHQRLRVKAALLDMSMQAFVSDVVAHAVADVVMPKMKGSKRSD